MAPPEITFCGDDFTGASDTLATLARGGLKARLYLDPPGPERRAEIEALDAVGVATALRTMPAAEIAIEARRIAERLVALRPRFVHYKICSTFDSSPDIGSIGAAVAAFRQQLDTPMVAIIGGQPSLRRHCVFGTLFAASGDETFRIDRHPVMSRHPVTPMAEADLRRHLASQGLGPIALIDRTLMAQGMGHVRDRLTALRASGVALALFDILDAVDVALVGDVLRREAGPGPLLIVGASSVAEALLAAADNRAREAAFAVPATNGPVFVMAGSRSPITQAQIDAAASFEKVALSPALLGARASGGAFRAASDRCAVLLREGAHVLAFVEDDMEHGHSRLEIAAATAEFAALVAAAARPGCLAIAGGDTASLAIRRLGVESISYLADLDPGVSLCCAHAPDPALDGIRLVLKGGQMGREDLFDRLIQL